MGMWQGILQGYESAKDRKRQEEAEAKLDVLNSENMRLKKVDLLAKYASKHGFSFAGGDYQVASKSNSKVPLKSSQHYINILKDLDINDKLITKSAGYGPRNLRMIVEKLQQTNTKHQKLYGKNSELPIDLYNDALESLIVTQRNSPTFDITKYEELFDVKLTDVEKLIITPPINQYPDISFSPKSLFLQEKSTQAELSAADKRGVEFSLSRATQEMSRLNKRASEILSISEQTGGNLSDNIQAEKTWIENRIVEVSTALADNKDGDFAPLAYLYGNNFMQEIIKYDPKLLDAPLNPAFTVQRDTVIEVPNRDVAMALFQSGILKKGMEVLNLSTGKKIRIGGVQ
tara:strand:- start:254 stop:1288 length:1035 start_codon:yes stop_codon:yes gene_type:complete